MGRDARGRKQVPGKERARDRGHKRSDDAAIEAVGRSTEKCQNATPTITHTNTLIARARTRIGVVV